MRLLLAHQRREAEADEAFRLAVRARLKDALGQYLPGIPVWVYGSLAEPGRFRRKTSDVDLALERLPDTGPGLYELQSRLSSVLGVPVDITLLEETRLRAKIRREGERWTG